MARELAGKKSGAANGTRKGRKKQADPPAYVEPKKAVAQKKDQESEPAVAKVNVGKSEDGTAASAAVKKTPKSILKKSQPAKVPKIVETEATKASAVSTQKKKNASKRKLETSEAEQSSTKSKKAKNKSSAADGSDDGEFIDMKLDQKTEDDIARQVAEIPLDGTKAKPGKTAPEKGVIYLGRIPHGFYEAQLRSYFSQFGDIDRLRLSRNKRTGASKHYGFIEFKHAEVANIVAETMNQYLMYGRLLQCKVMEPSKVHDSLFAGSDRVYKPRTDAHKAKLQKLPRNSEEQQARIKNLKANEIKKNRLLKDQGIDYSFDGVQKMAEEIIQK